MARVNAVIAGVDLRAARWLMLLQTARGKSRPITASVLAVELGVSERTLYRDIAELTAQGAPIYGLDIDVLQFVGRRIKNGTPVPDVG
jgi:predicted DNA-binding transcriptional regulator YafY